MSAPHILVVDDEADIRSMLKEILEEEGYEVSTAGDAQEARSARQRREPDLVLLDIWMPDIDGISLLREWANGDGLPCPVIMMSGHGTVDTAVEATRLGAHEFLEKPLSMAKLLNIVEGALEAGRSERDKTGARASLVPPLLEPIGKSRLMQSVRDQVRRVAPHDNPVLLLGEAGTGRETLARYMHSLGSRRDGEFVNAVLSGINDDELEVRLFGEENDDGTVAGLLDQARGGTLFLNELTDMSPAMQRYLLSVFETGRYTRVGGTQALRLDVRVISSASPRISGQVEAGRFRRDLYNHLDVITIPVPPLRDYREDVPDLLRYYVDVLVDAENLSFRRFSVAAQNRLRNYPWPGNIRELKNMVHRFLLLGDQEEVSLEEVEEVIRQHSVPTEEPLVKQDLLSLPLREAREHFERAYLEQQLALCEGKVGRLAERVGMERTHLYRKLRSLGVDIRHGGEEQDG